MLLRFPGRRGSYDEVGRLLRYLLCLRLGVYVKILTCRTS
jgi:hypothetical protein